MNFTMRPREGKREKGNIIVLDKSQLKHRIDNSLDVLSILYTFVRCSLFM